MEENMSVKNINEIKYISIENLELLYSNIHKFFFDIHKIDILNYNVNIKKIILENMNLIYGAKYASSLKTKELNIITLKNIKTILEDEIKKSNVKKDNNVDIISRENNIYNRTNDSNKILEHSSNNEAFNIGKNKNFSNEFDKLLTARNTEGSKKKEVNFNIENVENEPSEKLTKSMESLLEDRNTLLNEINSPNPVQQQPVQQQPVQQQPVQQQPVQQQPVQQQPVQQQPDSLDNEIMNIEGFNDNNFSSLFDNDDINGTLNKNEIPLNSNVKPEESQYEIIPEHPPIEIKKQIIVICSSNRDLEKFPNPYNYIISLKKPINNILNIKLLNVLITLNKVKSNINYLILNVNNFNLLTSNNEKINNEFALIFDNKKYNEELSFIDPLDKLEKFEISIKDKNNKFPEIKENFKKNENILEFLIEYF
jgi:hypothetical protein